METRAKREMVLTVLERCVRTRPCVSLSCHGVRGSLELFLHLSVLIVCDTVDTVSLFLVTV